MCSKLECFCSTADINILFVSKESNWTMDDVSVHIPTSHYAHGLTVKKCLLFDWMNIYVYEYMTYVCR